jgi:hypothetical protein
MTAAKSNCAEAARDDIARLRERARKLGDDLAGRANAADGDPRLVATALEGFAKAGLLELAFLAPDGADIGLHGARCAGQCR